MIFCGTCTECDWKTQVCGASPPRVWWVLCVLNEVMGTKAPALSQHMRETGDCLILLNKDATPRPERPGHPECFQLEPGNAKVVLKPLCEHMCTHACPVYTHVTDMCMHVCVHDTCTCEYVSARVLVRTHMCTHVFTHVLMHVHTCVFVCVHGRNYLGE